MRYGYLILWVVGLLLLGGCERPSLSSDLPDDGAPVPVSRNAALSFLQKSIAVGQQAPDGVVTVTLTQEEVTSFIALGADLAELMQMQGRLDRLTPEEQARLEEILARLELDRSEVDVLIEQLRQQQEAAGLSRLPLPDLALRLALREPQVYFKGDGRIIVRGFGEVRGRRQPVRLVSQPFATSGTLELAFVEGVIGPVPVPATLVNTVSDGVANAILAGQQYAEITELRVEEGTLTFSGRRN